VQDQDPADMTGVLVLADGPDVVGTGGGHAEQRPDKLCAMREKDQNFVAALLDAGLVDPVVIADRLKGVPSHFQASAPRAAQWLAAHT
jgi:hypothetical protein